MFDDIIKSYDLDVIRKNLGTFISTIGSLGLSEIIHGIISCFGIYDDIDNVGVEFTEKKVTITFEDKTWIFPIGNKNV